MEYDCFEHIFGQATEYEVIPETVGQYINHEDKDNKRIFEGDLLGCSICADEKEQILEVTYFPESTAFVIDYEDTDTDCVCVGCFIGSIEIIGNIHDEGKKYDISNKHLGEKTEGSG